MVRSIVRAWMVTLIVATVTSVSASAATLEIRVTGLDLVYENGTIHDATALTGGNGVPSEADPLTAMTFLVDGVLVGSLTSDIYADVAIFGIDPIPVDGGLVQSFGGGFDLLTGSSGFGLGLNLFDMAMTYSASQVSLSGVATAIDIFAQNLPFSLVIEQPLEVVFVLGALSHVTDDGEFLTSFDGSGTGSVVGSVIAPAAVPEPTSLILLSSGLLGLAARKCRRRRHA